MLHFIDISRIFFSAFMLALAMPIFWIVLFLVYMQYRRQWNNEKKLFGRPINSLGRQMLISVGLGILGGFIASAGLVFLGLSLEQIGLYFIWPVALFLLLINPRYLCFSYAGGIVALLVLFFRHLIVPLFPFLEGNVVVSSLLRVHIPAVLVLIAMLHLVEALLIYLSGHRGCSPIYLKSKSGDVVGAFSLQRFWPIPLVAFLVSIVARTDIIGVSMPEWWPILQSTVQPGAGEALQYMIIPVAAGLGYADMALSSSPRERSRYSSSSLAFYSILLLIVAIGSEFLSWLVWPGVIFAPLGHELLILLGKNKEDSRRPRYHYDQPGVPLMMVLAGTAAAEAGLREDDVILKVNGADVFDNRDLINKIEESYFMVLIEGTRAGNPFSAVLKKTAAGIRAVGESFASRLNRSSPYAVLHRSAELGLIPAPAPDSPVYLELRKPDPLARLRRLKKKLVSQIPLRSRR